MGRAWQLSTFCQTRCPSGLRYSTELDYGDVKPRSCAGFRSLSSGVDLGVRPLLVPQVPQADGPLPAPFPSEAARQNCALNVGRWVDVSNYPKADIESVGANLLDSELITEDSDRAQCAAS